MHSSESTDSGNTSISDSRIGQHHQQHNHIMKIDQIGSLFNLNHPSETYYDFSQEYPDLLNEYAQIQRNNFSQEPDGVDMFSFHHHQNSLPPHQYHLQALTPGSHLDAAELAIDLHSTGYLNSYYRHRAPMPAEQNPSAWSSNQMQGFKHPLQLQQPINYQPLPLNSAKTSPLIGSVVNGSSQPNANIYHHDNSWNTDNNKDHSHSHMKYHPQTATMQYHLSAAKKNNTSAPQHQTQQTSQVLVVEGVDESYYDVDTKRTCASGVEPAAAPHELARNKSMWQHQSAASPFHSPWSSSCKPNTKTETDSWPSNDEISKLLHNIYLARSDSCNEAAVNGVNPSSQVMVDDYSNLFERIYEQEYNCFSSCPSPVSSKLFVVEGGACDAADAPKWEEHFRSRTWNFEASSETRSSVTKVTSQHLDPEMTYASASANDNSSKPADSSDNTNVIENGSTYGQKEESSSSRKNRNGESKNQSASSNSKTNEKNNCAESQPHEVVLKHVKSQQTKEENNKNGSTSKNISSDTSNSHKSFSNANSSQKVNGTHGGSKVSENVSTLDSELETALERILFTKSSNKNSNFNGAAETCNNSSKSVKTSPTSLSSVNPLPPSPAVAIPSPEANNSAPTNNNNETSPSWGSNFNRPQKEARNVDLYSRKVFVGGLPPDIDETQIHESFSVFGALSVDWPHKCESKANYPPKGYAFLLFKDASSVKKLMEMCMEEGGKHYYFVSSPSVLEKLVQIRPWRIKDTEQVVNMDKQADPRRTIFVGGIPRPLKASELASFMEKLYGHVCYAAIDVDPDYKYPKGAGKVTFSELNSYLKAIAERFVNLHHHDADKRVEVKPYFLDDQICDECHGSRCCGRYATSFCPNIDCLKYLCAYCWPLIHAPMQMNNHKPLVKQSSERPPKPSS